MSNAGQWNGKAGGGACLCQKACVRVLLTLEFPEYGHDFFFFPSHPLLALFSCRKLGEFLSKSRIKGIAKRSQGEPCHEPVSLTVRIHEILEWAIKPKPLQAE